MSTLDEKKNKSNNDSKLPIADFVSSDGHAHVGEFDDVMRDAAVGGRR